MSVPVPSPDKAGRLCRRPALSPEKHKCYRSVNKRKPEYSHETEVKENIDTVGDPAKSVQHYTVE